MGSDTVIAIPHHLQHLVTTAGSDEENVVNSNFLQENDLSDHVHITNILDEKASSRNEALDRWPTLFEILNRKTQAPVDLWSFYVYMRDTQQSIDYLDFWLDSVQHINLCKAYVKGLKKSIITDGANAKQYKLDGGYDDYGYDDDYDDTYDDEDYDENEKTRVIEEQQIQQSQQQQQQQQQQGSTQQDDLDAYDSQLIPPSGLAGPEPLNTNRNSNLTNRSSNSTGIISGFNNNQSNRNSNTKSVSSSVLLDLLMKQDLLEDNDAQRLSQFLRGEGSIRTSDPLIRSKINDLDKRTQNMRNSNLSLLNNNPNDPVVGSGSLLNIDATASEAVAAANEITNTIIKPEMVETLIKQEMEKANRRSQQHYGNINNNNSDEVKRQKRNSKSHYVTRVLLRRSTQHLLNTYFKENAEKKIVIPEDMVRRVLYSLEVEGRDDPEVFDEAREYVFKAMEHEAYPNFLRYNAMGNITQNSSVYRLIFAIFCAFAGFWVGYALIFLKWDPKPERAVVTIPFFFSSYSFFSSIFRIDPILTFLGYGENKLGSYGLVKIKEPFVKKFLIKRSLFVSILICIVGAALSILFALVPGRRIQS
ncbi:unnamed protein product [[Candida] boidinii]|uniref:Unnamed protein product n=1 Tax=Candida boidinii TaxID=5477 RepID=A0A9W6ST28_CANBO|nr:hypothetical protein B5S30_g3397 [[Candida] boidinii]OWB86830.1 hypothetical protein B5S33_g5546 [[Candida] boidinii]GME66741.1 unnamed protein product [[Candida] boidinii]